jgi:hypothetical protein
MSPTEMVFAEWHLEPPDTRRPGSFTVATEYDKRGVVGQTLEFTTHEHGFHISRCYVRRWMSGGWSEPRLQYEERTPDDFYHEGIKP